MEPQDMSKDDVKRLAISSVRATNPQARPNVEEDLSKFAVRWSHQLEEVTSPDERMQAHEIAGEVAERASDAGRSGGSEFARTWLRRLANDINGDRLALPLSVDLERMAQRVIRSELQNERDELTKLLEMAIHRRGPMEFVRRFPRAAGSLRDLGRLVAAFQGSGILSHENPERMAGLIRFDEALRDQSRRTFTTVPDSLRITREELLQWADSGVGHDLPGLIRHLVSETTEGIERMHFPTGVGASSGDWDGFVRAAVGDAFVPEGLSVWELTVDKNSNSKAEMDYSKRLTAPAGDATSDVTYIQVVCRPWVKARSFASTHSAERRWKEVRAYNVDDLETWLEHAPATTVWLSEILGRPIAGIRTAEQWWDSWLGSTRIPLRSAIVLAGREAQAAQLRERIAHAGVTTIGGEVRLEEVKAFVAGVLNDTTTRPNAVDPPVLILEDLNQARKLLGQPGALVALVPSLNFLHDGSLSAGHHIIVPVIGSDRAEVILPPVSSRLVTQVLETEGLLRNEADEFGALARRSLLALRRRLAIQPELHHPSWASPGADVLRRRVLLLNAWNQTIVGDCDIVAELMGQPYQQIEDSLRSLANAPDDPMVAIIDERWHIVSPMDAWLLLGSQLSTIDLEAFRRLVLTVLLEADPIPALPEEQRIRAQFKNATRRFSSDLTSGVTKSLALLGVVDKIVTINQGQTGGSIAGSIVWEVLNAANADSSSATWITIAPHLPVLAEAAPSAVLGALQIALSAGSLFTVDIFADKERGKFGSPPPSPHTHVLWTLETLVWSPEHFDAAISLLVRLVELDPGGEWANRPNASLASIFSPWHPNTSASVEQRSSTLQRLRHQHPSVAWNLLLSMLPNARGLQIIHQGPTYREWKRSEPVVTRGEYATIVRAVATALLEDVGNDPNRWVNLIEKLNDMPPEIRGKARERLRELAETSEFGDKQEVVWDALHSFISTHREYSDAKWALPSVEVDKLGVVADALAPVEPHDRHAWLFDNGLIELGDVIRRDDFRAYDEALSAKRTDAVNEILRDEGFEQFVRFAVECALPGQAGAALARTSGERFEEEMLQFLESAENLSTEFSFGYFGQRFRLDGWSWLDQLIDKNKTKPSFLLSQLLQSAWDRSAAAERADSLGGEVAHEFWKNISYMGMGHDFQVALKFSERLVGVGRNAAALDLLALYARQGVDADYAEAIARAFESLMASPEDPELHRLSPFEVDILLKILAKHRRTIGLQRAVRIEWFFLPMLGYNPDARTLQLTLAEDPKFFTEVIAMVFKSDSDRDSLEPRTEQQKSSAENALHLLWSWSLCPGTDEAGEVNLERLREWASEARRLLGENGRTEIGDEQIGQALAAAPADEDGTWPCEPVRVLLEDLQSDDIDFGIVVRVRNNRGLAGTSRSLDEGGRQEWELSKDYQLRSEQLTTNWPRAAAIHRRLAESYEADARREDSKAERHRRGLER